VTVLVYKLSPSMNIILNLIWRNELISQREIIVKSGLAPRTVKYSLKKLKELEYISEIRLLSKDLRYKFYKINSVKLANNILL
jgi:DNA-binding MarR family transcriptional regulator